MDEEPKSAGDSSTNSSSQSRSLQNNHANTSQSNSKPSSSNPPHKQQQPQQQFILNDSDMSLDGGGGDDLGWWNCSLCTYKNSADKFKCEICDLRRGTSTRKPRCNADTIVAQVVKQQEQIRQQTRASKTPKSRSTNSALGQNSAATSSTDSATKSKQQPSKQPKTIAADDDDNSSTSSDDSTIYESHSGTPTSTPSPAHSPAPSSSSSTASIVTSTKSSENRLKIIPLEVNGNLIKYSPPTSSGRTGLIIDKKRFTQHSVTVNDVTITFTEFATRQNRYVRKKKKKRLRTTAVAKN